MTENTPAAGTAETLEPDGLVTDGMGWQQRKSAQTRVAILEATVECLATHGYARTTTQLIAQIADVSRGAMLHHYATKQDLIESVIDYIFFKRMEFLAERINALTDAERVEEHRGIEIYWQGLLTRQYNAYLELCVAARTDEELRTFFLPKARRYDRLERDRVLEIFPEWRAKPKRYLLAMDFCTAAMEGLLLNRDIWDERDRRVRFRQFVSQAILMLRDGGLSPPGLTED